MTKIKVTCTCCGTKIDINPAKLLGQQRAKKLKEEGNLTEHMKKMRGAKNNNNK